MRRSVQPNCPRAMTCCFFVSLKMLAMPAEGPRSLPPRQRLERLLPMAVFQVSMYGRFWVWPVLGVHRGYWLRMYVRYAPFAPFRYLAEVVRAPCPHCKLPFGADVG